ncbi:Na(+)/H(+) exchange regulatory cofactor NHE-RF1 [Echinococcus granulosus]|uniref:Na(+)/H(+) exchange regulatory cofactor NHE-RF1 n=1 Tax=Echinococcus granulosus TaxID=6210 RepID=W6UL67_ECHGR|nr:Na(+)/H(+) exchange regulatory cofactor NHE-RF1 [Echinococcus granulosus]EUB61891.1 Na(+)/H(+) exchange regulatory cofactor NHE-RF1 [Echinococcus granulosus]
MAVPRYCCMRLEDKTEGYGFSLIATKNQTGQYIDEVKEGSLADRAGLKSGDFVVEVNGENIHGSHVNCTKVEAAESSEPTPVVASQPIDDEESKKANEPAQSPLAPAQTSEGSELPNSSRTTSSRKACMQSGKSFGARAKFFNRL